MRIVFLNVDDTRDGPMILVGYNPATGRIFANPNWAGMLNEEEMTEDDAEAVAAAEHRLMELVAMRFRTLHDLLLHLAWTSYHVGQDGGTWEEDVKPEDLEGLC